MSATVAAVYRQSMSGSGPREAGEGEVGFVVVAPPGPNQALVVACGCLACCQKEQEELLLETEALLHQCKNAGWTWAT